MQHKHHHHSTTITKDNYEEVYRDHEFTPVIDSKVHETHRHFPRVAWALDVAKEIGAKKILDLGSLDGFTILTLMAQSEAEYGHAVELSDTGVQLTRERAERLGLNIEVTQDNILNFTDMAEYDLIVMFEVLEHFIDPFAALEHIRSHMKPGATLLITTPAFESPQYGANDEANHFHLFLFTTKDEDYDAKNIQGNTRHATSLPKALAKYEIISMDVVNQLIHARVKNGR